MIEIAVFLFIEMLRNIYARAQIRTRFHMILQTQENKMRKSYPVSKILVAINKTYIFSVLWNKNSDNDIIGN